jgi:hypothetical protein
MVVLKKKIGKSFKTALAVITCSLSVFAQSDDKFQIYGFADMAITKYFPEENSIVRSIDKMDEKANFSLDHVNLYTSFRPNKHLRFLAELSFQDEPVYFQDSVGLRWVIPPMPELYFPGSDSVWVTPKLAPKNKIQRGITIFEWGSFSVERALFSVYLNRYLNFTFGKFITPAGIWNVDHGSPVIMTISQPTQYSYAQIYPKSQLGIMEDGKIFIGDADLSYSIYFSSGRDNQSLYNVKDLSVGGQLRLNLPLLDEFNIGFSGYTGRVNTKLRYAVYTIKDLNNFAFSSQFSDVDTFMYRENVVGGDIRLSKWRTTLQAEVNYQHITDHRKASNNTSGTLATYVIGSVDVLKKETVKITPYAYYEYLKYLDRYQNPLNNITVMSDGYHKFMGGINFRAFTNYGVKLEYNFTKLIIPNLDQEEIPGIGAQFYIAF